MKSTFGRSGLAWVLVLALFLSFAPAASAASVEEAEALIEAVSGLTATVGEENGTTTIIVTGSATGVTAALTISDLDSIAIIWEASLSGAVQSPLVRLNGSGIVLRIQNGGSINNTQTAGSTAVSVAGSVYVEAGGVVESGNTGIMANTIVMNGGSVTASGSAIVSGGGVTVSGGTVTSSGGTAIDAGAVTVSGSGTEVKSTGGVAIKASNTVTVSGGAEVTGATKAIETTNNAVVEVSNSAIKATGASGVAIYTDGDVLVTGGSVSATGTGGVAINAAVGYGSVTVSGGAAVTAAATAIYADGDVEISDSGTVVMSTGENGCAIDTSGDKVTVRGGLVTAIGSYGIAISSNGEATVSGGSVTAEGANGIAIYPYGDGSVIMSGGAVAADGSYGVAIDNRFDGENHTKANVAGKARVSGIVNAEFTVNNGATLVVPQGKTLIINGNESGVLNNNGVIYLEEPGARLTRIPAEGALGAAIDIKDDEINGPLPVSGPPLDTPENPSPASTADDIQIDSEDEAPAREFDPAPIIPVLYGITKSGDSFSFELFVAHGNNNMAGSQVSVRLNDKYATMVTVGENGIGRGTIEAPRFTGGVANFSARVEGAGGGSVSFPMIVYSTGEVARR